MSAADETHGDPLCCVCGHSIACVEGCCATDDGMPSLAHNGCTDEGRELRADLDATATVADADDASAVGPWGDTHKHNGAPVHPGCWGCQSCWSCLTDPESECYDDSLPAPEGAP